MLIHLFLWHFRAKKQTKPAQRINDGEDERHWFGQYNARGGRLKKKKNIKKISLMEPIGFNVHRTV
jgi:hypothetical protein